LTGLMHDDRSVGQRPSLRVVIADDECLFRTCLRQLLSVPPPVIKDVYGVDVGPGFEVVGESGTGEETVKVARAMKPDLLLLDLSMPRLSGLDALRELEESRGTMRTILLSGAIDQRHLMLAVELRVQGLILKDSPTELLFEAIACVLSGKFWLGQTLLSDLIELARPLIQSARAADGESRFNLTSRERQVLRLVAAGCENSDIARELAVSTETIKHHLTRIFGKIGVSNRAQLATVAVERGLVDPQPPESPTPSSIIAAV
jgi:DNA-binding NarL/FixJ family response regulator